MKGIFTTTVANYEVSKNLSKSKSSILRSIELSTETRNHKPTLLLRPACVSRPLRQTGAFPRQFSIPVLRLYVQHECTGDFRFEYEIEYEYDFSILVCELHII